MQTQDFLKAITFFGAQSKETIKRIQSHQLALVTSCGALVLHRTLCKATNNLLYDSVLSVKPQISGKQRQLGASVGLWLSLGDNRQEELQKF